MPGFTEDQKALIEKVAWAVADELGKRLEKRIGERIKDHQHACPLQKKVGRIAGFFAFLGAALALVARWGWTRVKGE